MALVFKAAASAGVLGTNLAGLCGNSLAQSPQKMPTKGIEPLTLRVAASPSDRLVQKHLLRRVLGFQKTAGLGGPLRKPAEGSNPRLAPAAPLAQNRESAIRSAPLKRTRLSTEQPFCLAIPLASLGNSVVGPLAAGTAGT